ncbi:MAG: hypothetical protein ACLRWP_09965 [Bilophila wadsworthia]
MCDTHSEQINELAKALPPRRASANPQRTPPPPSGRREKRNTLT